MQQAFSFRSIHNIPPNIYFDTTAATLAKPHKYETSYTLVFVLQIHLNVLKVEGFLFVGSERQCSWSDDHNTEKTWPDHAVSKKITAVL